MTASAETGTARISRCSLDELRSGPLGLSDGSQALFEAHYREMSVFAGREPLVIQWDTYEQMERLGRLLCLQVVVEHEVVGYAVLLAADARTGDRIDAHVEAIYLDPEHRRGGLGQQLLDATREAARGTGARDLIWHAKPCSDLQRICEGKGMEPVETLFRDRLRGVD
jgi:GNAT superfamily N-acetyltransferase